MSGKPVLGYWDLRGLAEPIRYLLHYSAVDFADKRYVFTDVDAWKSVDKPSLGLDFPNLPYYIDGDTKLTQSLTILRYLARKHGLAARDEPRQARQELVEQQVLDVRQGFVSNILMNKDYETKRADYLAATLEPQLDLLVKFLGDKQWLIGGQLSYVDFLAYDVLDWLKRFTPDTIGKYPTIGQYLDRFEALPAITAYQKSPQHKAWPIFGPRASWGAVQM